MRVASVITVGDEIVVKHKNKGVIDTQILGKIKVEKPCDSDPSVVDSGIGAVKFIDVDVNVESSTTTKTDYVVDGLEFVSSAENPTKWNAFSSDEVYIAFITPKEITGTPTTTTNIYNCSMCTGVGNTNYVNLPQQMSYGTASGIIAQAYGIYNLKLNCTNIVNGKPTGNLTFSVRHHNSDGYEVVAGTYNIQVWYLTSFDWGHKK